MPSAAASACPPTAAAAVATETTAVLKSSGGVRANFSAGVRRGMPAYIRTMPDTNQAMKKTPSEIPSQRCV